MPFGYNFPSGIRRPGPGSVYSNDGNPLVAAVPCDILLTPHPGASGFWKRIERRKSAADAAALIDRNGCRRYAAAAKKALNAELAREHTETK